MKSAVLFIVFNRPITTQVVFDAIREARPPRLYVSADGPRLNVEGEHGACEVTRAIIKQVDWECDVKTLFRESNLGCRDAVSGAIDWFFDNEQEGVILEDDVVPAPAFFGFCDLMLERYRFQENVAMISGFNPLGARINSSKYFYSRYASIWGWATWRSQWKFYDSKLLNWSPENYKTAMGEKLPSHIFEYFIDVFEKIRNNQLNTWDYQWSLYIQLNEQLVIKPEANLITNIGVSGTHSHQRDKNHHISYGFIDLDGLSAPKQFAADDARDSQFYRYAFDDQRYQLLFRAFLRKLSLLRILRKILKKHMLNTSN
jgi:hypothetical protein